MGTGAGETVANSMSGLLTQVGSFVTAAVDWIGDIVGCITDSGNEILLIGFIAGLCAFAVRLTRRLINL